MSDRNKKFTGPCGKLDERRAKVKELIKERMKTADNILKDKQTKTGIEGRLEESDGKLQELIEFGNELVTNIKVASEIREIQRRNFEDAQKNALLDDLGKESTEAIAMFNNITDRWSELNNFKEPVAMFNQLEKQKERIAELMASKDCIIDKCQSEIDRVSDKYYEDQQKQSAEICSLVERIDNQVELIKQAYKNQLDLLQDAIEEERLNMAQTGAAKWEALFETLKDNEVRKVEIEKEKEKFYVDEVEKICREQQEITRATRIRLERDAEALELELHNTQNNVLMNSEKLDYDYQVLQKRNEENVIINNQQKRRVARFKEKISLLKAKIHTIREKAYGSVQKMSLDVQKLYAHISELEKKSQQFLRANEKKYRYVWNINYQEALSLMNRIFEIDRLLHEQQLGVLWVPQHVTGIIHNPVENTTTGRSPMSLDIKNPENEEEPERRKSTYVADNKTIAEQLAENRLLRSILKKVSDRAGFLIEEKLLKILEPYTEDEKCLVRIDNIFNALRITEFNDIMSLTEYFMPYAWCPNCANGLFTELVDELCERVEEAHQRRPRPSLADELDKVVEDTISSSASDICSVSTDDVDRNINVILTEKTNLESEEHTEKQTCSNHYLVIKPAFVVTALRNFTETYLKHHHGAGLGSFERAIVRSSKTTRPLPKDSVEKFWSNFLNVMPAEKQKLWKTLEHGLDHYLEILKEREQLDLECEFLRRQNSELRHLLQKHLPSAV